MRISDWSSDVCSSDFPKDGCERIQNVISARKRIRRISIFESELWQVQKRPASKSRRDDQERRRRWRSRVRLVARRLANRSGPAARRSFVRSEEHTSELQSLMRISYAVFCLKKKTKDIT